MGGREIDVRGGTPFDLYNSDQTTDPYVQVPGPNALDPDSPAVETPTLDGTADYERDPWSYRANVGLRFRWDPE